MSCRRSSSNKVLRFRGEAQFARDKGLEFQLRMVRLLVNIEQPREIHRAVHRKHLPGIQLEVRAQPLDDLGIGIGLNLQAHRVAFAPVVQFGADRLQQTARFFFRQIQIAVARYPESRRRNNVVAVIHACRVMSHQVGQKNKVIGVLRKAA